MIFVGLILLPDLPTVKHHKGCRLNVVGAMGKGRISERSEGEINSALSPLLREVKPATCLRAHFRAERGEALSALFPLLSEVKPDFHWETETPVLSLRKSF